MPLAGRERDFGTLPRPVGTVFLLTRVAAQHGIGPELVGVPCVAPIASLAAARDTGVIVSAANRPSRSASCAIKRSPILGWSDARTASGVAALFILCNSVAGLLGNVSIVRALPPDLPLHVLAVLAGAAIGTTAGIRFATAVILRALGLVLVVAGLKLIGVY